MSGKVETDMVTVRWDMPGSRYDGLVHDVSANLVDDVGEGRVVAMQIPWQGVERRSCICMPR